MEKSKNQIASLRRLIKLINIYHVLPEQRKRADSNSRSQKGISEKKCKEIRVSYKELGRLEQGYLL